eukprot:3397152-Pleurochrysis_carterae.AAC.1
MHDGGDESRLFGMAPGGSDVEARGSLGSGLECGDQNESAGTLEENLSLVRLRTRAHRLKPLSASSLEQESMQSKSPAHRQNALPLILQRRLSCH